MRILVVDDDPISRRVVQASLHKFGHSCDLATDGAQGWDMFVAEPYDVVISDWDMPVLSGVDLCRKIRSHPAGRRAYVIIVTVRGRREDVIGGMTAGADDYLSKPLDVDELQVKLIAAERITALHEQIETMTSQLQLAARTDPLTGVGNRLALHEELEVLHARVSRYGSAYAVGLIDVDFFKGYNDACGHLAGDKALVAVAGVLSEVSRQGDRIYRYGGEEFVCVLPEQRVGGATVALERMRAAVRGLGIEHSGNPHGVVTVSAGVACFVEGVPEKPEQVLAAADEALYRAKQNGRDRVEVEP